MLFTKPTLKTLLDLRQHTQDIFQKTIPKKTKPLKRDKRNFARQTSNADLENPRRFIFSKWTLREG